VFENRVLRGIFGPKGDEIIEGWRTLDNGKLHDLYSSPNISRLKKSRKVRWAGHAACMGEECIRVLVRKPIGKRPLGDIDVDGRIMDHRGVGCEGVDWIHLAQDRDQWRALVNRQ
jgi:hypothetical protein